MNLRTLNIVLILLSFNLSLSAQSITRAEFVHYDLRTDAKQGVRSSKSDYIAFEPTQTSDLVFEQVIDMPQSWFDNLVFIHLEDVGSGYDLVVNGRVVDSSDDSFTPLDYNITKYLQGGENRISVHTGQSTILELEENLARSEREQFANCYIYLQNKLRIADYLVRVSADEKYEHGRVHIDVVVENGFNFEESIEVGFDIYDPKGDLLDFSTSKISLKGGERDTIRFAPHIYGANKKSGLYDVMIFTKRNGASQDYIPFQVSFLECSYNDGSIEHNGNPINIKKVNFNALRTKETTEKELLKLKAQGFNTVVPSYPQPLWFYSLCDKVELYVIEQAAINAPSKSDDRRVGGTPSNNPELLDTYLNRVKNMYYRTRNFSCIIGYSLGSESGNGYNMQRAYLWLKGVERVRPVWYEGAKGEWNSDIVEGL